MIICPKNTFYKERNTTVVRKWIATLKFGTCGDIARPVFGSTFVKHDVKQELHFIVRFQPCGKETPAVASCIISMPTDVTINIPRSVTLGCVTAHYTLFTGLSLTYQFKQAGSLRQAVNQYVLSRGLLIKCPVS